MDQKADERCPPALVEQALLTLCAACAKGKTFSPMEAAKSLVALEGRPEAEWPSRLTQVRRAAVRLAQQNRLTVYRKGRPADPAAFKGVYRLGPAVTSAE